MKSPFKKNQGHTSVNSWKLTDSTDTMRKQRYQSLLVSWVLIIYFSPFLLLLHWWNSVTMDKWGSKGFLQYMTPTECSPLVPTARPRSVLLLLSCNVWWASPSIWGWPGELVLAVGPHNLEEQNDWELSWFYFYLYIYILLCCISGSFL